MRPPPLAVRLTSAPLELTLDWSTLMLVEAVRLAPPTAERALALSTLSAPVTVTVSAPVPPVSAPAPTAALSRSSAGVALGHARAVGGQGHVAGGLDGRGGDRQRGPGRGRSASRC